MTFINIEALFRQDFLLQPTMEPVFPAGNLLKRVEHRTCVSFLKLIQKIVSITRYNFCVQIFLVVLFKSEARSPGRSPLSYPGLGGRPMASSQFCLLYRCLALEGVMGWAVLKILHAYN